MRLQKILLLANGFIVYRRYSFITLLQLLLTVFHSISSFLAVPYFIRLVPP